MIRYYNIPPHKIMIKFKKRETHSSARESTQRLPDGSVIWQGRGPREPLCRCRPGRARWRGIRERTNSAPRTHKIYLLHQVADRPLQLIDAGPHIVNYVLQRERKLLEMNRCNKNQSSLLRLIIVDDIWLNRCCCKSKYENTFFQYFIFYNDL